MSDNTTLVQFWGCMVTPLAVAVVTRLQEMAKRSAVEYSTLAAEFGVPRHVISDIATRYQSAWLAP
jgi:hypothetical protein